MLADVCVYTAIGAYVYMNIYIHIYVCAHKYTHTYIYIRMYMHIYLAFQWFMAKCILPSLCVFYF
jgi:hypothetical protein